MIQNVFDPPIHYLPNGWKIPLRKLLVGTGQLEYTTSDISAAVRLGAPDLYPEIMRAVNYNKFVWKFWKHGNTKWTTRLSKYLHDECGLNVHQEISKIGAELGKMNTNGDKKTIYLEIDNRSNWSDGDFGEASYLGCCWLEYAEREQYRINPVRKLLMSQRVVVFKFFRDEEAYYKHRLKGIARTFAYCADDYIVTFNPGSDRIYRYMSGVATALGLAYKRVNKFDIHNSYTAGPHYAFAKAEKDIPDQTMVYGYEGAQRWWD